MIVTNSNVIPQATITDAAGEQGADNLKSTTGAGLWAPLNASPSLDFTFSAASDIGYIAGVGQQSFDSVTATLSDGTVVSTTLDVNGVFVFYFENPINITGFTLDFVGMGTLMNVSAGSYFSVPNGGEQSGYDRAWMRSPFKHEAVLNRAAIPVAITGRRESIRATLSIRSMPISFAETIWRPFSFFAERSAFYILEDETSTYKGYLCFEPKFGTPSAHSGTRQLVAASVTFQTYTGV